MEKKEKKGVNEEIKALISSRLDNGQKEYKQDVPVNDHREYTEEALE